MKYKILRDRASEISSIVNEHLADGWELHGQPFRTGNKILLSGDMAYPGSCKYTNEIGQAVIKETENG